MATTRTRTSSRTKVTSGRSRRSGAPGDVDALLASLAHSQLDAIRRIRELVLGAHPNVVEEIKWNAPSFAVGEHFATFHLRGKQGVVLVMHFGAKKRAGAKRPAIADPTKLLEWLADDRATIRFVDLADVEAKRKAFVAVVRSWIAATMDVR
ncbi:MAG: DUF1801 domain-containing protein [Kofleriaceae bacterium]|nr:DUF1801 domain-containing protein [Kofleriaceae bacterium]